jgi:hypothetical protein
MHALKDLPAGIGLDLTDESPVSSAAMPIFQNHA